MKLYGADVCPFVHRARLALLEKELEFEYVNIDLRDKPDWYYEVLPTGKVPLLEDGEARVWESAIVCEYLEDAYPEKSLMPSSARERAQVRLWIDWASNELIPAYYQLLTEQEGERQHELRQKVTGLLFKLDREAFQDGPFLVGDSLTLADIGLYPWFDRWVVLQHYRNFLLPTKAEKVAAWQRMMSERESARATTMPAGYLIEQYAHYAEPEIVHAS